MKQTLVDIIQKIETFAPPQLAEFDYVGLLQGDINKPIKKIGLTLDYTYAAIKKAIANGCNLLITHHGPTEIHYPLFGNNLKKIESASSSDLAVYRCHLNLDFCDGGIIDTLCNLLKIPAAPTETRYQSHIIKGGVYLAEHYPLTLQELLKRIQVLGTKYVRIAGKGKQSFSRIAITSGQGFKEEFFDQLRPEVYIAGEFEQESTKYAEDLDIMLVELSHHASETVPLKYISKKLERILKVPVDYIEITDTIQVIEMKANSTYNKKGNI